MTPLGFTCEHPCCVDDKPHAHLMDPTDCGDCRDVNRAEMSDRARELEVRAQRIGNRHPSPETERER